MPAVDPCLRKDGCEGVSLASELVPMGPRGSDVGVLTALLTDMARALVRRPGESKPGDGSACWACSAAMPGDGRACGLIDIPGDTAACG